MPKYIKKDAATGAIRLFFATSSEVDYPLDLVEPGVTLVVYSWTEDQTDTSRFYMPDDQVVERPCVFENNLITIPADGETKVRVDLPAGTIVRYGGETRTADAEEMFEFSSAVPGEFVFSVEGPFPYQPQTVRIIADAL